MSKETEAIQFLREVFATATRPAILFSSGKDSLVAAHLSLRVRDVEFMWWRLAQFTHKHQHGNFILRTWGITCHDAMPLWVDEVQHKDWYECVSFYGPDPSAVIGMTTGVTTYEEGKPYLCAVQDLLNRPTVPKQGWLWDTLIQGHKNVDTPYLGSAQKITEKVVHLNATIRLVNPLAEWTDGDVWEYIKRYRLPVDRKRYMGKDTEVSPDSYRVCFRCRDTRKRGEQVWCPKLREHITNTAKSEHEHQEFIDLAKQKIHHVHYTGEPQREVSHHV